MRPRRLASSIVLFAVCACQNGGTSRPAEAIAPTSPPEVVSPTDPYVLPGDFSEQTTIADLQVRFGESNVKAGTVPDGAGGAEPGVVLFPNDPTRRAFARFYDAERTHLANVVVVDAGSRWRGKHGVHIGMSLAELRARNGKAFWFTGFDADGRGSVRDTWDAGSLDVDIGEMYFGVDLRVRGAAKGVLGKAVPRGDESISSDDPHYPKLGELVEVSAFTAWSSLDDE